MQRKRKSKSEWLTVLAAYKESGLNGSAFCRQEQICRKSFYNAKARYSTCTAESVVAPPSITSQFVQVFGGKVNQNTQSDIEVILPHGRLHLSSSISPTWVANLFKSLAA